MLGGKVLSDKKHPKLSLVIRSILIMGFAFVVTLAYFSRQYIVDQIAVWQFKPAAGVTELVQRAGMNDRGKFYYLASRPVLDATQDFNTACSRTETIVSILGCYNNGQIYIYDVKDPKLDGIREVTAAHETLHAVYERLDDGEKTKVDSLLEAEYKKLSSDKSLSDRMAFYDRTESGQRDNELHSVIGTEIASISPELESYYKTFFTDRQKVVDLNIKYLSVFKSIESQANTLKSQMDALAISISSREIQYNADVQVLTNDVQSFNERAKNNLFTSQSQFDQERAALVNRINAVEAEQRSINDDVAKYNSMVVEYNSLATQSQQLYQSIDSTLAPAPSL